MAWGGGGDEEGGCTMGSTQPPTVEANTAALDAVINALGGRPGSVAAGASPSQETRYRALEVVVQLLRKPGGAQLIGDAGAAHAVAVGVLSCMLACGGGGVGGAHQRQRHRDVCSLSLGVVDAVASRCGLDLAILLSEYPLAQRGFCGGGLGGGGGGGGAFGGFEGGGSRLQQQQVPAPVLVRALRDALLSPHPWLRAAACDCVKVMVQTPNSKLQTPNSKLQTLKPSAFDLKIKLKAQALDSKP
jgi:hypothetical protein